MYTAHGDFFNAWHAESMQYIVDSCMNKPTTAGSTCSKNIPVYYSAASANARLTSTGSIETSGATLVSAPNDVIFIKFPTPANLNDYAYVGSFLQTLGGNVTDTAAVSLYLYAASTDWDDAAHPPTAAACGATGSIGRFYADNVQQVRTTDISAYVEAQKQAGAKEIALCIRYTTTKTFQFSSRQGSWTPGLYLK